MGFYAFGTKFQSRFFARKDISWRVRKPNAKQNRFQEVTISFLLFFFSIFLRHYVTCSLRFWQSTLSTDPWLSWADPEGGQGVRTPPPLKSQKIGFLSNTGPDLLKITSYQASIQCWAIIGPPAKRVSLAG